MSYKTWANVHAAKHAKIIQKLLILCYSKEQIIDYFDYENMRLSEEDFCLLYAQNKKCHDMDELNCYFCACPNFRFCDDGILESENSTVYSECSIKSKDGRQQDFEGKVHQDCTNCEVPHTKEYIGDAFDTSWSHAMSKCEEC